MMADATPLSILVLEDQGIVRAGMRELIQICEPRSQIYEAATYEAAIALLGSRNIEIAFLDIDLKSQKSGLDVLRTIRDMNIDTRAIMLSGRSGRELVMECIEAGASGYILKDMDGDGIFRRALDAVFQGSIFLPSSVLGRGGFTPQSLATPLPLSVETLGIKGRSLEVLYYLCQGMPNKMIANRMAIEEATVRKDYVSKLLQRFGVSRRTELIVEISRRGMTVPKPPDPSVNQARA